MEPEREDAGALHALEVRLLLEAIHARYGYDLRDYSPPHMKRRLGAALARYGLPHLGELQHRILHDPSFFAAVLDELTVQVSDLFRDPPFYRAFRERVIPVLRTYPLLRIWHAGCATGEEAYATAILLTEEGLYDRAQIYATDLSVQALAQAKQGVFAADRAQAFAFNHARSGAKTDFAHYCTIAYDQLAISETLRRNILFFQHNLVSDQAFGEMHVIFCRNVFLYFGPELRARVIHKFAQSLCAGGFLCLGNSEQLSRAEHGREFVEFASAERVYRSVVD